MRCWQHATPRDLERARQNSSLIVMYRESEEKREMAVDGTDDKGEGVCGGTPNQRRPRIASSCRFP